jgi:1-deoxy-D-xylulose-5-phosphate reductoisomerase
MIGVTILGATGSIGISTLDVLARHPDRFRVVALAANRRADRLYEQCLRHRPRYAVLRDPAAAAELRSRLRSDAPEVEVLEGAEDLEQVAALPEVDQVMAAIVGAAGLLPTLAAARAGKRVLLANKEALVMSGALFMEEVRRHGAELLPIDSEHNAVFQCMPADFHRGLAPVGVRRILLTASGGPFRDTPVDALESVTPEQACAHPNWSMGRKISVDSATMMNKGLEVIEACWLFDAGADQVEVLIQPQSIIHSMVAYSDGSVLAQLGNPDMRTPIAHALAWPERLESGVDALDILRVGQLDFRPVDRTRYPCLELAYQALDEGGTASAILNAANEMAVDAFLDRRLGYMRIAPVIAETMATVPARSAGSLEEVFEADAAARRAAQAAIRRLAG